MDKELESEIVEANDTKNARTAGLEIIDGLKEAIAGNYARVTIDGNTWVRMAEQDAKPMIERELLNDMIDFFKGRSRDVAIYVRARGIDLEASHASGVIEGGFW